MLTQEEYRKSGDICPCCGSDDVDYGSIDIPGVLEKSSEQEVSCNHCGAEWYDVYKLDGYRLTLAGATIKNFTVFCQDVNGLGTTWIEAVAADSKEAAADIAVVKCAEDWGRDNHRNIRVLGIIEGDVKVAYWEDL